MADLLRESDQAYRLKPGFEIQSEVVARYPSQGPILQSGWLLGEDLLRDQANVVAFRVGQGYVVTMGSQVDFRAQPRGDVQAAVQRAVPRAVDARVSRRARTAGQVVGGRGGIRVFHASDRRESWSLNGHTTISHLRVEVEPASMEVWPSNRGLERPNVATANGTGATAATVTTSIAFIRRGCRGRNVGSDLVSRARAGAIGPRRRFGQRGASVQKCTQVLPGRGGAGR